MKHAPSAWAAALLPFACASLPAAPAGGHGGPPVLLYAGGKRPHVAVVFDRTGDAWGRSDSPHVFRLGTPRGEVTVRWHEGSGTESGGLPPRSGEIAHPDTVYHIALLSPRGLPVYFRGAGDAKWAHLNGRRLTGTESVRMHGGHNTVDIGYPDVE